MQETLSDIGIAIEKASGRRAHKYLSYVLQKISPAEADMELSLFLIKLKFRGRFNISSHLHRDSTYFECELRKVLNRLDKDIILFIDDIDRLVPQEVPYIMRFIEYLKDYPRIRIVVAVDPISLSMLLQKSDLANPRKYIEKIVDVKFTMPGDPYSLIKFICDKQKLIINKSHLRKVLAFELFRHSFSQRLDKALQQERELNMYAAQDDAKLGIFAKVLSASPTFMRIKNRFNALDTYRDANKKEREGNIWIPIKKNTQVMDITNNGFLSSMRYPNLSFYESKGTLLQVLSAFSNVMYMYQNVSLRNAPGQESVFALQVSYDPDKVVYSTPIKPSGRVIDLFFEPKGEDLNIDLKELLTPRLAVKIARRLQRSSISKLRSHQDLHKEVSRIIDYEVNQ